MFFKIKLQKVFFVIINGRLEKNFIRFLFNEEYGTISGKTMEVVAASTGSVTLGSVNIPTDETEGRVKISGLMGYRIGSNPGWLSASITGKLGNIK